MRRGARVETVDGRKAPLAAVRDAAIEQPGSTLNRPSRPRRRIVGSTGERSFAQRELASSRRLVELRLCLFQIGGVEALGEPAVNRREQITRFGPPALFAP